QERMHSDTDFMARMESMKLYTTMIVNVMHAFQVTQMDEEHSMESALSRICEAFAMQNIVQDKDRLRHRLLEREKAGGLGVPSTSIILFHTRSRAITHPNLTIYSLRYPISVRGMDGQWMDADTLLFMLAPEAAPQEMLEVFSYVSSLLVKG